MNRSFQPRGRGGRLPRQHDYSAFQCTDHVFLQPGFGMDDGGSIPQTGGSFTNAFFGDANGNFLTTGIGTSAVAVSGVALGGTGSPSLVQSGTQSYVITQTVSGVGALIRNFPQGTPRANV